MAPLPAPYRCSHSHVDCGLVLLPVPYTRRYSHVDTKRALSFFQLLFISGVSGAPIAAPSTRCSAACLVKIQIQAACTVVLWLAEPPSHTHVVAADSSISAFNPFHLILFTLAPSLSFSFRLKLSIGFCSPVCSGLIIRGCSHASFDHFPF